MFYFFDKVKALMANVEPFNLNEYLLFYYDYDDVYELEMELANKSGLMVNFISTFNTPCTFESIATPSNNMGMEGKIAWELLKTQLTQNQMAWVLHHKFYLPYHFFLVNDGKKPNLVLSQNMCCFICHYVS